MFEDYEQTYDGRLYKTVIMAELPAFARFDDLVQIALDMGVSNLDLEEGMKNEEFPRPINEFLNHHEGAVKDERMWGIWVHEEAIWAISDIKNKKSKSIAEAYQNNSDQQ